MLTVHDEIFHSVPRIYDSIHGCHALAHNVEWTQNVQRLLKNSIKWLMLNQNETIYLRLHKVFWVSSFTPEPNMHLPGSQLPGPLLLHPEQPSAHSVDYSKFSAIMYEMSLACFPLIIKQFNLNTKQNQIRYTKDVHFFHLQHYTLHWRSLVHYQVCVCRWMHE